MGEGPVTEHSQSPPMAIKEDSQEALRKKRRGKYGTIILYQTLRFFFLLWMGVH